MNTGISNIHVCVILVYCVQNALKKKHVRICVFSQFKQRNAVSVPLWWPAVLRVWTCRMRRPWMVACCPTPTAKTQTRVGRRRAPSGRSRDSRVNPWWSAASSSGSSPAPSSRDQVTHREDKIQTSCLLHAVMIHLWSCVFKSCHPARVYDTAFTLL